MNRKKLPIIIVASCILLILCILFVFWQNGSRQVKHQVNTAFKEAIDKNYQNRLLYMSYARPERLRYDLMRYIVTPPEKGKVKNYVFRGEKGNTILTLKDSVDSETGKRLVNEYLFSEIYPIKVDELDALFRDALAKYNITGRSGVVYFLDSKPCYSHNDSIVPATAYCTSRYTLDIMEKVKVQAWVDYSFGTVISHVDNALWWFIGLFILIPAALLYFYRKKANALKTEYLSPSPKGIEIDLEKQELCINGTICNIQKLDLTLLDILYRKADECITREDIKQTFWPTDDNANEKIDAHIKAIRKILKEFPEYELVTVRGKGYYLTKSDPSTAYCR